MTHETEPRLDTPGLANGPGPTPPGFQDNGPWADQPAPDEPGAAEKQRNAGEAAERSAGVREAELRQDGGGDEWPPAEQPEEKQPDEG